MANSSDYITTGGGKLYIRPIVDGVKSVEAQYFGVTDSVTLSLDVSYVEHSNTEGSVSVTDKKVAKSKKATIKFTTGEISPKMIERAYQGKTITISQVAGTDTTQTLTAVKLGYVYDLGVVGITELTVKDKTDAITYVEGTDYTIDLNTGYMEILESGSIVEASDLHLTVSYGAYEKTLVASLKGTQLEAELVFISDPQVGKKYRYTFKKVAISASGDFALKSEDFTTLTFEGEALVDESITDPDLSTYFDVEEMPNA